MVRTINAGLLILVRSHICSSAIRIAIQLVDGPISIDKIRVHDTDLVVLSLCEMPKLPKHRTWSPIGMPSFGQSVTMIPPTLLLAARQATVRNLPKRESSIRMLTCAAESEVIEAMEVGFLSWALTRNLFDRIP